VSGRVVHVNDRVDGAVYIGRPVPSRGLSGSPFGNPFRVGREGSRAVVLLRYADWLYHGPGLLRVLPDLRDKPLACWCRHDGQPETAETACHGDVLLELLANLTDDELRVMGEEPCARLP